MADLGDRIKHIAHQVAAEIMAEWSKDVSAQIALLIEQRLRDDLSGDRGYIASKSTALRDQQREQLHAAVRRMFNGSNATQIARELKIGRATVYRILKRPG